MYSYTNGVLESGFGGSETIGMARIFCTTSHHSESAFIAIQNYYTVVVTVLRALVVHMHGDFKYGSMRAQGCSGTAC